MVAIPEGTQIAADGQRWPTGTGPTDVEAYSRSSVRVQGELTEGDVPVFDEDTGLWLPEDVATSEQGALAESALQDGDVDTLAVAQPELVSLSTGAGIATLDFGGLIGRFRNFDRPFNTTYEWFWEDFRGPVGTNRAGDLVGSAVGTGSLADVRGNALSAFRSVSYIATGADTTGAYVLQHPKFVVGNTQAFDIAWRMALDAGTASNNWTWRFGVSYADTAGHWMAGSMSGTGAGTSSCVSTDATTPVSTTFSAWSSLAGATDFRLVSDVTDVRFYRNGVLLATHAVAAVGATANLFGMTPFVEVVKTSGTTPKGISLHGFAGEHA